jgi:hypothetical protein
MHEPKRAGSIARLSFLDVEFIAIAKRREHHRGRDVFL